MPTSLSATVAPSARQRDVGNEGALHTIRSTQNAAPATGGITLRASAERLPLISMTAMARVDGSWPRRSAARGSSRSTSKNGIILFGDPLARDSPFNIDTSRFAHHTKTVRILLQLLDCRRQLFRATWRNG